MERGDSAGGSAELAKLIDEHGEAIYFDFLRYTPFEIDDVLVPGSGLTARKALAIIRNLPLDSATVASIRGGVEFKGWDNHLYMLANLVDAVKENTYVFVAANAKRKPKPPKPIDRPTAKQKKNPLGNRFAMMARIARKNAIEKAKRKAAAQ